MDGENVFIVNPATGKRGYVPRAELEAWGRAGYQPEAAEATENARLEEEYGDSPLLAAAEGAARTLTFGGSDAALGMLDAEGVRERRDRNAGAALVGEIGGALLPIGAPGVIGRLGGAAEEMVAGSGLVREAAGAGRLSRALAGAAPVVARGAAEGAAYGATSGISDVALSEDPVTVEGALTTIGSSALFGAGVGGAAGAATELLSGAARAGRAMARRQIAALTERAEPAVARAEGAAARTMAPAAEAEELGAVTKMDRAAVRNAEKAEQVRVRGWARGEAQKVFDEAKVFSKEVSGSFINADSPDQAVRLGKARKNIMRSLDDPKGFVESPYGTAKALRVQESAIDEILAAGQLSERGATEARDLLQKNVALQERIKSVTDLYKAPASPMLDALQARADELAAPAAKESFIAGAAKGAAFSGTTGALTAVGVPSPLAALAGGKVAELAGEVMAGRALGLSAKLAQGATEVAARLEGALDAFAKVGAKAARVAPPAATQVLEKVSYAPSGRTLSKNYAPTKSALTKAVRARVDELTSQVEADPTRPGKFKLTAGAAKELHERLSGLWATQPKFADQLEAAAARRVTFLAEKIPKRPPALGMPVGPDHWQPSDMEARKFGRYAEAVENPAGIVERLADGSLTPEDAEVMKNVYPGLYEKVQVGLVDRLTELRQTLPYQRRLTLSIMFGVDVDPSMSPPMVSALQRSFVEPPQSPQMPGASAAQTAPGVNVGALKAPQPTRAQKTAG